MKQFKVILAVLISALLTSTANSANIDNLQAVDNGTVRMTASEDVVFSDSKVYGEVKVLRDIDVSYSSKDLENNRKVVLNLSADLYSNSVYSLIGIIGAEGNIDFEIGSSLNGEIMNWNIIGSEQTIEKVNVVDSRTLEVYFNYDLEEDMFEFKLLSELKVDSLSSLGNNILDIYLQDTLGKSTSYIIMIISLEDIDGNELMLDESLYDLVTTNSLMEKPKEVVETEEVVEVKEIKEVVQVEEEVIEEEGNIEEVALNSAETPDTGAETWVLMLLTFIFSSIYFIKNKISKA